MNNLLKQLTEGTIGLFILNIAWNRYMPIPYEIMKQGKSLLEFEQDPTQIVAVFEHLEEGGLLQAAYSHSEAFGILIVLPIICSFLSLCVYHNCKDKIGELPFVWIFLLGCVLIKFVAWSFSIGISAFKVIVAMHLGPMYKALSIIKDISP